MYKSNLHMFLSIALTISGFALGSFIGLRSKESKRADALIHEVNTLSGQLAEVKETLPEGCYLRDGNRIVGTFDILKEERRDGKKTQDIEVQEAWCY